MKRRREQPEAMLQRALMQHVFARSARGTYVFAVPNGGKRSRISSAIFKGLGVRAGVPDLICIKAGQVCAIELKSPTGRLSKHQRATIDELTAAGCLVRVIDNIDDAVAWLEKLGFLKGHVQ